MKSKILTLTVFVAAALALYAFRSGESRSSRAEPGVLDDSLQARRAMAEELIAVYPQEAFAADLAGEVASVTGQAVAEEARAIIRSRLTSAEVRSKRVEYYAHYFTVSELQKLRELYASPEGAGLLKALGAHRKAWGDFVAPIVLQALSNYPIESSPLRTR